METPIMETPRLSSVAHPKFLLEREYQSWPLALQQGAFRRGQIIYRRTCKRVYRLFVVKS